MCRAFEEVREESIREGERKGARANSIAVAQRMLRSGKYGFDEIVEVSGLTLAEVKNLAEKKPA